MKKGYTLVEVLIVITIIGVIASSAIATLNRYNKGLNYVYSYTYYALDKAIYNAKAYWIPQDEYNREPFQRRVLNPETKENTIVPDKVATKRLCEALTEYINTINNSCTFDNQVTSNGQGLTSGNVYFTTANGVRFWISKRYPTMSTDASVNDDLTKYFIIYADLNGTNGPNSMDYEERITRTGEKRVKDPDTFAFAVLETGRICPIGIPEVNPRYLTTRIMYQGKANEEDENDNNIIYKYSKKSKPYVITKGEAWGYYTGSNNVDDDYIMDGQPLSYNGYILQQILAENNNSVGKIYKFLGNHTSMSNYIKEDETFKKLYGTPSLKKNDFKCSEKSDDECSVIIDKFVQ